MAGGVVHAVEGDGEGAGTCRVGAEPEAVGIRQYSAGCVHRPVGLDHAEHIVCVCSALACDGDAESGVVTEAEVQRGKVGVEQARALRQGYGPRIVLEEDGRALGEGIDDERAEARIGTAVRVVAQHPELGSRICDAAGCHYAPTGINAHGLELESATRPQIEVRGQNDSCVRPNPCSAERRIQNT